MISPPALTLRTGDFERSGLGDRSLRRLAERGAMTRIVPGAYIESSSWASLSPREQYVTRAHASVERLAGAVALSHWSAAAVWGFPVPDRWPSDVQITDPKRTTSNKIATLHRRPGLLGPHDVVEWEGVVVTTPARTAADLALTSTFEASVVVFDHGLHVEAFTRREVTAHLITRPRARRRSTARAALEFASASAESPGESFSRIVMAERGFVAPTLQESFFDSGGPIGFVDFWWPEAGVVGEFDGEWKYADPRFTKGRTAAQVVRDEKRRQSRLEAHPRVTRVVRWDYAVARDSGALAARLAAAGVPRGHPSRRLRPSESAATVVLGPSPMPNGSV